MSREWGSEADVGGAQSVPDSSGGPSAQTAWRLDGARLNPQTSSSPVVRAMGSRAAALRLRAPGRAPRVIAARYDQGVPADRLRGVPPPKSPTYPDLSPRRLDPEGVFAPVATGPIVGHGSRVANQRVTRSATAYQPPALVDGAGASPGPKGALMSGGGR